MKVKEEKSVTGTGDGIPCEFLSNNGKKENLVDMDVKDKK